MLEKSANQKGAIRNDNPLALRHRTDTKKTKHGKLIKIKMNSRRQNSKCSLYNRLYEYFVTVINFLGR